ncbi:MAG: TonB-dependent receptor [Paludibacter sp.]|nr:TonB-dependent receptor [Paludibacter sp.]
MKTTKLTKHLLTGMLCMMFFSVAYAQNIRVSGTVSDEFGPLTGVSVTVKGATTGTVTNMNGEFSLQADATATLKFSFIGYIPQEIPVNNRQTFRVIMKESSEQLDEVVVVGYGSVRKSDLTGAVSSIQAADLSFPTSGLSEMLRGKAAGVQVTLSSGRPGAGSDIRIRGNRSLTASNTPLYIVDGVQVESINVINPTEIASVDVLKDASSQAIYGARAANGVVLITTKKGVSGKPLVTYDAYVGTQSLWKNFEFYNADEFYELRWQGKRNYEGLADDERTPDRVLSDPMMQEMWEKREFVNWNNLMFKNAWEQKHDLSVRGATDKMKYALVFGYFDQDGMVAKSNYNRANFRLNTDYDVNKFLTIGTNFSFIKSWSQTEDGSFEEFITRPPIAKVFEDDGSYTSTINSEGVENPLYKIQESDQRSVADRMNLNLYVDLKPFKGFTYRINAAYKTRFTESGDYKTNNYPKTVNSGTISDSYYSNILLENIVTYEQAFGKNHRLTFTFVQSAEKEETKTTGFGGSQVPVDFFKWDGLGDAININSTTRTISDETFLSYLGRVNYSLFEKYLLTASMRADASSVFGKNNKWGYFPSAALAWRISEEAFIKPIEWISNLKLRLSYGMVGNKAIPSYRTLGITNSYEMRFGDDLLFMGYSPTDELKNPNLKWESTASTNIGLDFGFFNGRITGSVESYNTRTTDLLVKRYITSTSGYTYLWDNLAETKTRGWEATLGGVIFHQKDFDWQINATFATARSEIVRVNDKIDAEGKPMDDIDNRWYIGKPISVFRSYIFDGIWQKSDDTDGDGFIDKTVDTDGDGVPDRQIMENAKPGDVKVKDMDGNGYITVDDQDIRSREPDWTGSLSSTLFFKGFDLYAELYTVQGILKNNTYLKNGNLQGKLNAVKVNYWTPENPSNEYPRPNYGKQDTYDDALGYQDASYVRLRTLSLGYTLPHALTSAFFVDKLRFYFTATNLWTSTKYLSYSPELSLNAYPEARQFIFGLNVQF